MPYFRCTLLGGQPHVHVDLRLVIHHPRIGREFVARHRNQAHRFAAAGDHDVRAAGANPVRRHRDRLQSGSAEAIDGHCRDGPGRPARNAAMRAMFMPGFGLRASRSRESRRRFHRPDLRIAFQQGANHVAARSSGRVLRSVPRLAFPTGVRRQSTILRQSRETSRFNVAQGGPLLSYSKGSLFQRDQ